MDELHGNWMNIPVRDKDGRKGVVVEDCNGQFTRYLDIKFEDGETYTLELDNTRPTPPDRLRIKFEWAPGEWGLIASGN